MINYKNYLLEIKTIHEQSENEFKNYIYTFFNNWFTKLNKIDLNILSELCFFLIIRIKNLFNINSKDIFSQFTKNNNQDIKAITLLFLPFLNDDETNIYKKLNDLNEIMCLKDINETINEIDKNTAMKEYFKYSTMGVGLFLEDGKLEDDLIYKIIFNKFLSLLNTLSIINGKMYINWINICPLNLETYKNSYIFKETQKNLNNAVTNYFNGIYNLNYNGLYIGEFYNVYRNIFYENIKKIKWILFPYTINNSKLYLLQHINTYINIDLILQYTTIDELPYDKQYDFINKIKNLKIYGDEYILWKNFLIFLVNNYSHKLIIFEEGPIEFKKLKNLFSINDLNDENRDNDYSDEIIEQISKIENYHIDILLKNINPKFVLEYINEALINFKNTIFYDYLIVDNKIKKDFFEFDYCNLKNLYNIAKSLSHDLKWNLLPEKYESLSDNEKEMFWKKFNLVNKNWLNIKKNLNIEYGYELNLFDYNKKNSEIINSWNTIKYTIVWEYLVKNGILNEFIVGKTIKENFTDHHEW
jgi:hypothetical protein